MAHKIRKYRIEKRYTLENIAEILGITKSSMSKKERGIIPFTVDDIKLLRDYLKLSPIETYDIFLK